MAIQRVSTYAQHQNVLGNASRAQVDLAELQRQVSSGVRADTYEGLGGQVEQFSDLEQKIGKASRYKENNALVISRLTSTSTALEQILDTANSFKNVIVQRRSATTSQAIAFQQGVEAAWKAIAGQLNTSMQGRFLFSGTRTDAQPVDDTRFPTLAEPGIPDDTYYLGSREDISVRAQDNFELAYNVRADDPAFQKIAAALSIAKEADLANDDEKLSQAFDLMQEGIQGLVTLQAQTSTHKVTLQQINERHDSLRLYWQGVREEILNTDVLGATTQVAVNQGILQASFQVFARISALRLSDFLR